LGAVFPTLSLEAVDLVGVGLRFMWVGKVSSYVGIFVAPHNPGKAVLKMPCGVPMAPSSTVWEKGFSGG
jgi:hypothetical protein